LEKPQRRDSAVPDEHGDERRMSHVYEVEEEGADRHANRDDAAKERRPMDQREQQLLTPPPALGPRTLIHEGIVAYPKGEYQGIRLNS
jgi:hypothetical protein